ncbi:hypothetical protein, partial [Salmonella enterica]|uniref:hypothetical protein n=2 Tax=Enterobacteriaceae TaxID=543 RepID=UPI001CB6D342
GAPSPQTRMLRLYLLKIPFSSVPFQHCEARRKINPVICNAHAFSELSTQNTSLRTLPLSLLTRQTLLINIKI